MKADEMKQALALLEEARMTLNSLAARDSQANVTADRAEELADRIERWLVAWYKVPA
jgi:hypothetical protein